MNWLFVKGLARGQVHWDRQPEVFAEVVPDAKVFFLDLPGIGQAAELETPLTVAKTTVDLRKRFLELRSETPGPWSIFAISLGGMIAMEWTFNHPGDFERSVVIVSSAANVSAPWRRLLPATLLGFWRAFRASDPNLRERISLDTVTNNEDQIERLASEWEELAPNCPMPTASIAKQLFAALIWSAPKSLYVPTLLLGSEGDRMVHSSCTLKLARRFAAPVAMHPSAGHEIPLDDPGWVAEQVAAWLAD